MSSVRVILSLVMLTNKNLEVLFPYKTLKEPNWICKQTQVSIGIKEATTAWHVRSPQQFLEN